MLKKALIILCVLGSTQVFAAEDSSTKCGEAAMDAIVRHIIKNLQKPSDIDEFESNLSGSAELVSSADGKSTYSAFFLLSDRYNLEYSVVMGPDCKAADLKVEGYY